MRALLCLGCGDDIVTATGLTNEDARTFTAQHYQRTDLTHSVGPAITADDIVFAPHDPLTEQTLPDSLILVLPGAA